MLARNSNILPSGLRHGAEAARAVADSRALWLAGGPVAFAAAIRIKGANDGERQDRQLAIEEIGADKRNIICSPRSDLAGVSLDAPRIMGIVNATPDSFSDGGAFADPEDSIDHGKALIAAGADFLDIGGESTRPDAEPVSVEIEIARVVPVIEGLKDAGVPLSIDTRNAATMRAGIESGGAIVNDISALAHDPESPGTVAELGVPVILCHSRGTPANMREHANYKDVSLDVCAELRGSIEQAVAAGIVVDNILIDPGFGFAKKPEHNAQLLRELALLHGLGCAILVGASRKSFDRVASRASSPAERLGASLSAALAATDRGAQILRVHDVGETVQALAVRRAIIGT